MRHHYILGLDIAVGDLVLVQILYGGGDLLYFGGDLRLAQGLVLLEVGEQSAFLHVLQN